jgi:hypothetical protein
MNSQSRQQFVGIATFLGLLILGNACCVTVPKWDAPHKIQSKRVHITSDENPQITREVLQEAEHFLHEIESWLGKTDSNPTQVYLFKSYKNFQSVMKAKGEGITYYGCCEPVVAIPRWPMELEDMPGSFVARILKTVGSDWRFRLRHELIHVVFRNSEGLSRDWLWEGVADYFAHGGHLGGGMKAQRFLSLKRALHKNKLHTFDRLRSLRINASRDEADLLYAEAWSVIYTIMNLSGPRSRMVFRRWLKNGAPGDIEDVLESINLTAAQLDAKRLDFIDGFHCLIEAQTVKPGDVAYDLGLRPGDCLLQLEGFPLQKIDDRRDLGMYLSYLFQPPASLIRSGRLQCLLLRDNETMVSLSLSTRLLKYIDWRLTVRSCAIQEIVAKPSYKSKAAQLLSMKGG